MACQQLTSLWWHGVWLRVVQLLGKMKQEAVSLRQPLSSSLLPPRNDRPIGKHLSWALFWPSSQGELKSWYRAEIRERPSSNRQEKKRPETIGWGHWRRKGYVFLGSPIESWNPFPQRSGILNQGQFSPRTHLQCLESFWWSHLEKGCYWNLVG